ncbi:19687_t:CDS:1, partial [Dentiscutata erythropus]
LIQKFGGIVISGLNWNGKRLENYFVESFIKYCSNFRHFSDLAQRSR